MHETATMRGTILYLNLAHFLDHYFLLIFPTAVLVIHPAWGMGYGEALALGTTTFTALALATPFAGWASDRYGERRVMIVFFLGIGASSIATAFATGPITLAIGLAFIGLFAAIYHPVGTAYLVRVAEQTGAALGLNGVFGNMGLAAAAGLTGVICAYLGWRAAFLIPGIVAIGLGLAFARHERNNAAAARRAPPPTTLGASRADQIRVLAVVAIASLFGGLAFNGVTIALPKLFEERLAGAADLSRVGLYVAIVFALASFTQIAAGRVIDRVGAKPVMLFMTMGQVVFLLALSQVMGLWSVFLAFPLMLAVFGEVPVSAWLVSRYVSQEWRGRAYSAQFLLGLGVSALAVPLIAILYERTGNQSALLVVLAAGMALVFLAAWALPSWRRTRTAMRAAAQAAQ